MKVIDGTNAEGTCIQTRIILDCNNITPEGAGAAAVAIPEVRT